MTWYEFVITQGDHLGRRQQWWRECRGWAGQDKEGDKFIIILLLLKQNYSFINCFVSAMLEISFKFILHNVLLWRCYQASFDKNLISEKKFFIKLHFDETETHNNCLKINQSSRKITKLILNPLYLENIIFHSGLPVIFPRNLSISHVTKLAGIRLWYYIQDWRDAIGCN